MMKYEEERKKAVSYCGEYCHRCDWSAARIKEPVGQLSALIEDIENIKTTRIVLLNGKIVFHA